MSIHENNPEPNNPLGMDGIEFVEYATSEPLALGAILERMGFAQTARHRSREVALYRQGGMNVIVNADRESWLSAGEDAQSTVLSGIALRVRDANHAYRHATALGAWPIPTRADAMELNIPGVHGAGGSVIYFVDRYTDFSIYDVDFKPLSNVSAAPAALAGMHFFGVVQSVRRDRSQQWVDFYAQLMGFRVLPEGRYFGILPKGTLLESPCRKFYLQLIEPPEGGDDVLWEEELIRLGIGTPDVAAATAELARRGVVFVDREPVQPSEKGALTQLFRGGVSFELVKSHLNTGAAS
ncbi:4-hydroxyphenylpyruvate dioxygenase [Noviherbaspirillum pedocola]|uniref:4-hydroxyphenylpyruvate dioxygenase n=1 Tax=Noviherbaspirillum pedocola TaxID=2801341 RepID=A0A934W6W8_9BURK|nr:4-hydroxyphenylpyruvate dioxygenase [Noviherbaspirillum pedocola]MBK4736677.1 4-hydroxyphenylpyruvate dioxygenase [Noviherbaspirillum pedocola]